MDEHLNELREIPPETIADIKRACHTHLEIVCHKEDGGCGRIVWAPFRGYDWPDHWHVSEIRQKLVCETCKKRNPRVKGATPGSPSTEIPKTYGGHRG